MLLAKDVDIIGKRLPTTNWQSLNLKAPLKKLMQNENVNLLE